MKKLTTAFIAIALVAIGTIFVFAQKADGGKGKFKHGFGHHRGSFGRLAKQLNLTDAQKAQMKQIREDGKAKTQPLRESMKSIHQQLSAATADGNFNEAQVQSLAAQQANIMAQLIVEKERTKSQIFAILTPEQQTQAKALKDQMKERRKERFQNRGSKGDAASL
ncbi:MAG: Spy/CpxP family protein refolding chaperone [Acidobacteriota bacterium]